ncbi:MAG: PKD domain-containing protein, partial [Gammaproteobacteria bacterium]|nr:PKD domain-containing protein [Gammaproteobacteria bacterium]
MEMVNGRVRFLSTGLKIICVAALSVVSFSAQPFGNYLTDFNNTYGTSGTRIDNCGLCHYDFGGGGNRTPYGEDFRNNNYSIVNIGLFDSDGDGFNNDQESSLSTQTSPGFNCLNLSSAINAPANLLTFVDPSNPGCVGTGLPPVAKTNGPYVAVNGSPVSFNSAGSFDPDGSIVSYLWNFGGVYGSSSVANPVFTFNVTSESKINVSLTVVDNEGNSTSSVVRVIVLMAPNSAPVADAGLPVSGVVNVPVEFNGTGSIDPDGDQIYLKWEFGDGSTSFSDRPLHAFNRCGVYDVSLAVTDIHSLSDSATVTATIASSGVDLPVANAGGISGHYQGVTASNILFDGSSSYDTDCNITSYSWNFGDGTTASGAKPVHSYSLPGDYVVSLTVTDNDGLNAAASASVTVTDGGALNGSALYAANCAACHGESASTNKAGASVTRINTGISSVASMNSLGSLLSAAEIQAIADYLASLTPPPPPTTIDGASLYASSCAACHGATSSSTKIGATVARINTGISSVASMNSLSSLSAAQIQAIADYLASLTPPPPPTTIDGASLYASSCAACHGATSSSTKIGATALRINTGIVSVSAMNYLNTLTALEVQAIADYLATFAAPPPATDGATLYANSCSSCHGAGAATSKGGADVTRINSGIASVASMNYLSTTLSAADIQSIAGYLAQFAPSGGTGSVPHTDMKDGVGHAIDKDTPFSSGCTSCHGASLQGSIGPSCTTCHGQKWSESAPSGGGSGGTSVPHTDMKDGVGHAIDKDTPFSSGCTSCHGASLQGSIGPSCTTCHGQKWNESAPSGGGSGGASVPHTDMKDGVGHAIDKDTPFSSGCTSCHGASLQGSIGPSCTTCHGQKWNESAPPTGGTLNGEAQYNSYCAGCHGSSANSSKSGADVSRINNGIANVSSMNSLSSLSSAQIQAIADFLTGGTTPPPTGSTDGATLYANSCSGCHGAGAATSKGGADVTRINSGIASVASMNYLSTTLSAADIQSIAGYLAQFAPSGGTGSV